MKRFETSDIAQASYLYASAVALLEINRQNPRRCVFVFDTPDRELIAKWQSGNASVNAPAYAHAYQTLKAKLFQGDVSV